MKTTFNLFANIVLIFLLVVACNNSDTPEIVKKDILKGFVQKGPFNIGTSVSLAELTNDFTPTGKNFTTQITDNNGSFEFSNIELVSPYVVLQSNGFYFNEMTGENSAAQLTLYAIADISDQSTLNVNVLTHLEKPRVEYLVSQGKPFSEAKALALADVLNLPVSR